MKALPKVSRCDDVLFVIKSNGPRHPVKYLTWEHNADNPVRGLKKVCMEEELDLEGLYFQYVYIRKDGKLMLLDAKLNDTQQTWIAFECAADHKLFTFDRPTYWKDIFQELGFPTYDKTYWSDILPSAVQNLQRIDLRVLHETGRDEVVSIWKNEVVSPEKYMRIQRASVGHVFINDSVLTAVDELVSYGKDNHDRIVMETNDGFQRFVFGGYFGVTVAIDPVVEETSVEESSLTEEANLTLEVNSDDNEALLHGINALDTLQALGELSELDPDKHYTLSVHGEDIAVAMNGLVIWAGDLKDAPVGIRGITKSVEYRHRRTMQQLTEMFNSYI